LEVSQNGPCQRIGTAFRPIGKRNLADVQPNVKIWLPAFERFLLLAKFVPAKTINMKKTSFFILRIP
jgi:hypothetical protein